mmetsp:Transcript_18599/g.31284  ORF Transcript_18599/g.31284 Transcript_18599/m.31284 type:complete len:230 (-) Transcript_18599:1088-1777(-)
MKNLLWLRRYRRGVSYARRRQLFAGRSPPRLAVAKVSFVHKWPLPCLGLGELHRFCRAPARRTAFHPQSSTFASLWSIWTLNGLRSYGLAKPRRCCSIARALSTTACFPRASRRRDGLPWRMMCPRSNLSEATLSSHRPRLGGPPRHYGPPGSTPQWRRTGCVEGSWSRFPARRHLARDPILWPFPGGLMRLHPRWWWRGTRRSKSGAASRHPSVSPLSTKSASAYSGV